MRRLFRILVVSVIASLVAYRFRWRLIGRLLGLPARYDVDIEHNIPVMMPDGVRLMTARYYPHAKGLFPTILTRSTYGRGMDAPFPVNLLTMFPANVIASCGYNVIVQTTRGRFDSEGIDDGVFVDDEADGRATLDWISGQPWFNGSLSMFGSSYLGYTQWAVADGAPPFLKTIAPSIITTGISEMVFPQGAFALDLVQRWMVLMEAIDDEAKRRTLRHYLAPDYPPLLEGLAHLPMSESDYKVNGQPVGFFQRSLEALRNDGDYWRRADKTDVPAKLTIPVLLMDGWYDFCLPGLLKDYESMKAAGHAPYLTIGNWAHSDVMGQIAFLHESVIWYDAQLKGKTEKLRKLPVRIYVMGAKQWREMESWPPPARPTPYYLQEHKRLTTLTPEGSQTPDVYRYDPADPTPAVGGALFAPTMGGMKDNTELEARRDVLTFTTPPLSASQEVIGAVKLELYVRSSLEHTDFFGRLCDVHPDGRSYNICDGLFRVEPGKGEPQPDGTLKIEVDMTATAYYFKIGHRIRLQVSSGAHPRWSRNTGSGEPVLEAVQLCTADQEIYHDADHPSALILPIYAA